MNKMTEEAVISTARTMGIATGTATAMDYATVARNHESQPTALTAAARMLLSAAIALLLLAACTNELTDPLGDALNPATTPDGRKLVTVNITLPEAKANTRLAFEDLGYGTPADPTDLSTDQGLKLTWTTGDRLGVYDETTGTLVGSFDLQSGNGNSSGSFAFSAIGSGTFTPNTAEYRVVYPFVAYKTSLTNFYTEMNNRIALPQIQNSATMNHLAANCLMDCINSSTIISLQHNRAVMTVKMDKPAAAADDELPVLLNFMDAAASNTYTLVLEGWTDWTTAAHLMIKAVSALQRDLRFEVVTNKGNVYSLTKTDVTKGYSAGRRYTALLTAGNALTLDATATTGLPLASYSDGMPLPTSDVWIVNDAFAASSSLFGLRVALNLAGSTGRNITLVIPLGEGIKDYALQSCTDLVAVYMPAAQTIDEFAFRDCTSLASVSMPAAQTIGEAAFRNCTSLASVSMPAVETIGVLTFRDCTSLVSVSMPAVQTIGYLAFFGCTALASVSMPSVKTVEYKVFAGCTALNRVEIATAAGHPGLTAFGDADNDVFGDLMNGQVDLTQVDLILGTAEYGKVTGSDESATWRPAYDEHWGATTTGYGPFKSIANGQKP